MNPSQLHEQAMDLAEQAFRLKQTDPDRAKALFAQAYEIERPLAEAIEAKPENEPSRGIMYLSAASLAYNAGLLDEADELGKAGINGSPPQSIEYDFRDLIRTVAIAMTLRARVSARNSGKTNAMILTMADQLRAGNSVAVSGCKDPKQIIARLAAYGVEAITEPMLVNGARTGFLFCLAQPSANL